MAKVLWFHIPARGHITPTLPVVGELRRRGHDVIVYCTDDTRAWIEGTGAVFAGYPDDVLSMREIADATKRLLHPGPLMLSKCHRLVPFAEGEIHREAPDLVVYDQMAVWAGIAARQAAVPTLASFTMMVLLGSPLHLGFRNTLRWKLSGRLSQRATERELARLSVALGADAVRLPLPPFDADKKLVFVSPDLHPPSVLDERYVLVGPSFDERTREDVVDWAPPPGEGPLVFISTGTVNKASAGFYREVLAAFRDHPARFVMYIGNDIDPRQLDPIPENFGVSTHLLPQLRILEQSDVFVTHGGMNSVQEGLDHGVPQILIPQQLEQLINARRVAELGAGVVLGDQPPYGRVKAAALRAALDRILTDEAFGRRARQLGEAGRAAGGVTRAADELELVLSGA